MRVVQKGQGAERPVLLSFFCGVSVAQFAKDVGPRALVVSVDGPREPVSRKQLLDLVRLHGGDQIEEVAAIGYSAGCHGLRDVLGTVLPEVVIAIDGTHASLPGQPQSMPIGPWKKLADAARAGDVTFVATHIYNTYVEQLKPPPHGPYVSTVSVLRQITGWELPKPAGDDPIVRSEGDLEVRSYRSTSCDPPAHARQIQIVAPQVVREVLGSRWSTGELGGAIRSIVAGAERMLAWPARLFGGDRPIRFSQALLTQMQAFLDAGIRETTGVNRGAEIDTWCRRYGVALGSHWCALTLMEGIRRAELASGLKSPVRGTPGAKRTMAQFQAAGKWLTVQEARVRAYPGCVPVWHRGPKGAGTGHIGIMTAMSAESFSTIEGNSGPAGDRVASMVRRWDDPLLLGMGVVD